MTGQASTLGDVPSIGFDCYAPLSETTARLFRADGCMWVGRYLNNLTSAEVARIHAVGLAILPILTAATRHLGSMALSLDVPTGVHIWIDTELLPSGPETKSASIQRINGLAHEIRSGGWDAALYVGAGQPLTGPELYALAPNRYGKGASRASDYPSKGIPEPGCGFAWTQLPRLDRTRHGQRIDWGVIGEDFLGRRPVLWCPQVLAASA